MFLSKSLGTFTKKSKGGSRAKSRINQRLFGQVLRGSARTVIEPPDKCSRKGYVICHLKQKNNVKTVTWSIVVRLFRNRVSSPRPSITDVISRLKSHQPNKNKILSVIIDNGPNESCQNVIQTAPTRQHKQ